MMNITVLDNFNKWLYEEWKRLPNKDELALPYLITPSEEYCKANIKVLVLNRETNGWGEKEQITSLSVLKGLYTKKVNEDRENLGSVWPMYYALRNLSEEPDLALKGRVGFIHSNVALIGKPYDNKGYDSSIIELLQKSLDKQISLLKPDFILFGVGFGTEGHTEKNYLKIIEGTYLGEMREDIVVQDCDLLHKLTFSNSEKVKIYGYGHPQGLSYDSIVEAFKNILLSQIG